jgi:septum formation protein
MVKIVLASGSPARIAILRNAGVEFTIKPANIDERAIEAPLAASGELPRKIAAALAEEKALATANSEPDALVIGGDQILLADGRRWNKPANLAEARDQLMTLSGRSHELFSSIAVVRAGAVTWRHGDMATMTMRQLTNNVVDSYLAEIGETALSSVGAYQIEGPGIKLFERIEGDYFTILGLPLLPLLAHLREVGAIE